MRNLSFWAFWACTDAPRHPAVKGRHQIWHLLTLPWLPSPLPLPQRATAPLDSGTWEAAVAAESTGPLVHAVDSTRCPPGPALAGTWGLREPRLTSSVIWPPKVTHVPGRRHMGSSQRTSPGSFPPAPGCSILRLQGLAEPQATMPLYSVGSTSSACGDTWPSGQVSFSWGH